MRSHFVLLVGCILSAVAAAQCDVSPDAVQSMASRIAAADVLHDVVHVVLGPHLLPGVGELDVLRERLGPDVAVLTWETTAPENDADLIDLSDDQSLTHATEDRCQPPVVIMSCRTLASITACLTPGSPEVDFCCHISTEGDLLPRDPVGLAQWLNAFLQPFLGEFAPHTFERYLHQELPLVVLYTDNMMPLDSKVLATFGRAATLRSLGAPLLDCLECLQAQLAGELFGANCHLDCKRALLFVTADAHDHPDPAKRTAPVSLDVLDYQHFTRFVLPHEGVDALLADDETPLVHFLDQVRRGLVEPVFQGANHKHEVAGSSVVSSAAVFFAAYFMVGGTRLRPTATQLSFALAAALAVYVLAISVELVAPAVLGAIAWRRVAQGSALTKLAARCLAFALPAIFPVATRELLHSSEHLITGACSAGA